MDETRSHLESFQTTPREALHRLFQIGAAVDVLRKELSRSEKWARPIEGLMEIVDATLRQATENGLRDLAHKQLSDALNSAKRK